MKGICQFLVSSVNRKLAFGGNIVDKIKTQLKTLYDSHIIVKSKLCLAASTR